MTDSHDEIYITCPNCGKTVKMIYHHADGQYWQYSAASVPIDMAKALNGQIYHCEHCKEDLHVVMPRIQRAELKAVVCPMNLKPPGGYM